MRLTVLGTGKMAAALVRGWIQSGTVAPQDICLYNRTSTRAEAFAAETGAACKATAEEAVAEADVALVAVKPYAVAEMLRTVREKLPEGCLVLSVAAGVRLQAMEIALNRPLPVVRVMPNTAALVGSAAAAVCRGRKATEEDAALVQRLFSTVGVCVEVTEDQLDAVIGVSGSGVAYLYLVIEALTDGGVRAGLPRDTARQLAAQTALGAARMVLETGEHPAALKDAVTTPGGTTIAALEVLETAGLRGTLMRAVLTARDRARELG